MLCMSILIHFNVNFLIMPNPLNLLIYAINSCLNMVLNAYKPIHLRYFQIKLFYFSIILLMQFVR